MAVLTATDYAQQMIAQIRVLDPSISCEVGTPERKIIDTVAEALSENQIDLTGVQSALDVDSLVGTNLDRFTSLFGFQRQGAVTATGYVHFSRPTPATDAITIPSGTQLQASAPANAENFIGLPQFETTAAGIIPKDGTDSGAVPVRCLTAGTVGNVAANTITQMIGANIPVGVTQVKNDNALINGVDAEDDNSYKARFKNTWARNLAGTQDQYLALALSNTSVTKAVALGTQSRFNEYFQVPDYDDAGFNGGNFTHQANTYGVQNQWTSALSDNPYLKYVYNDTGFFVSNGLTGVNSIFFRPDADYVFNVPAIAVGDTLREQPTAVVVSTGVGTITVDSTNGFAGSGQLIASGSTAISIQQVLGYTGKSSTQFTGVTGTLADLAAGDPIYQAPSLDNKPNLTFINVNTSVNSAPHSVTPGQVVLAEYSYISQSSRNDLSHNVDNCVDVYVDKPNDVQASTTFLPNFTTNQFTLNANSPWYYEMYRRDGNAAKRPQLNNWITPLFHAPVDGLPAKIAVAGDTYYLGTHYWLVHEIGPHLGSVRARDGIEWSSQLNGDPGSQPPPYPGGASGVNNPTGNSIYASTANSQPIEVDNYLYDNNIVTLQATFDQQKQITTDALAHRASLRYFKLDITVVYDPNASPTVVNAAIQAAVAQYFSNLYFGAVIELSTLLEIIHQVVGVNNVRWSNDLPTVPNAVAPADALRVVETDVNGTPLHGASIDRLLLGVGGMSGVQEQQTIYVVGNPRGTVAGTQDYFKLHWKDGAVIDVTYTFPFNETDGTHSTASDWNTVLTSPMWPNPASSPYAAAPTFSADTRPSTNVVNKIRSFTLTYSDNGDPVLPTVTNNVTASDYTFNEDFYLLDHELPALPTGQIAGDTLPGLIIRQRAQNTLFRPGLDLSSGAGRVLPATRKQNLPTIGASQKGIPVGF